MKRVLLGASMEVLRLGGEGGGGRFYEVFFCYGCNEAFIRELQGFLNSWGPCGCNFSDRLRGCSDPTKPRNS